MLASARRLPAVTPPGQKSDHFVLVQVHVADVFVVLLVVIVKAAGFALGHGPRPPFCQADYTSRWARRQDALPKQRFAIVQFLYLTNLGKSNIIKDGASLANAPALTLLLKVIFAKGLATSVGVPIFCCTN